MLLLIVSLFLLFLFLFLVRQFNPPGILKSKLNLSSDMDAKVVSGVEQEVEAKSQVKEDSYELMQSIRKGLGPSWSFEYKRLQSDIIRVAAIHTDGDVITATGPSTHRANNNLYLRLQEMGVIG